MRVPLSVLALLGLPEAGTASPALESSDECIARATTPLPTCTPPATPKERLNLALDRATVLIEREQWSDAVQQLMRLGPPSDYGARVRRQALLGVALSELSDPRADGEIEQALAAWATPKALAWVRSLPSGDASARLLERTYDAAAGAAFQRAELLRRQTSRPLPRFARAGEALPFAPRRDSALTPAELHERTAWRARYRAELLRYIDEVFAPWARRQRDLVPLLQEAYEKVHFVPPGATAEWRVAVAASVGTLWSDFAGALRRDDASALYAYSSVDGTGGYSCTFDEVGESEERLARYAFEACVTLSREHRLLTDHTLTCEAWLASNYKAEHHRLDELMPTPHQESIRTALQFAPVSLTRSDLAR